MAQEDKMESTKERILTVAEALFAKKGYDAVSVREITTAASCNLAAVSYHFGNKQNLYVEVFRARWFPRAQRLHECFRKSLAAQDASPPTAVARALAKAFLLGPLSDVERQRHHQLLIRELGPPGEAFELVANDVMLPLFKELADILRPFMVSGLGEERLMLNILSILAMVLYFNVARTAVSRITGREYDPAFKDRLVEHIAEFSVKGLIGSEGESVRSSF